MGIGILPEVYSVVSPENEDIIPTFTSVFHQRAVTMKFRI